jgi:Bifunctional DNA primase/polymerase, N-terminal/Phage integrase family
MKTDNLTLNYAGKYTRRGWSVLPIPAREKAPCRKGWQNLRLKKSDLADYFSGGGNIGVLLGAPSKYLVDVDLDCDQAIFLASSFLPATGRIHGRKSKPRSHWYYYGHAGLKPEKFRDLDGKCLLELRSTGQQTIIPPSVHPSGERVRWISKAKPSNVTTEAISRALGKLAAATLLARHWPSIGSRIDVALALAGVLLRADWTVEATEEFISDVARAAHDDQFVLPQFVANLLESLPRISERYFWWTGKSTLHTVNGIWQRTLQTFFKRAEIKNGYAHRFRDTFSVSLLLAGVPIEQVAVALGHSNISVTQRHYNPWVRDRQLQLEADLQRAWNRDPIVYCLTRRAKLG